MSKKVLKAWGFKYGVWFGAGTQNMRTKPITVAWLKTVLPPYLRGIGLNFSLGKYSIRIGLYKRIARYVSNGYYDDDFDIEGELSALGWGLHKAKAEVIREWSVSTPSTNGTSEQSESKQPRSPQAPAPETEPSDSTTTPSSTGPSPSP